MTRRNWFVKLGFAALVTALCPTAIALGADNWPEFDKRGNRLRKVFKSIGGKSVRVRMKSVRKGDCIMVDNGDDNFRLYRVHEDAKLNRETGLWGVVFNEDLIPKDV